MAGSTGTWGKRSVAMLFALLLLLALAAGGAFTWYRVQSRDPAGIFERARLALQAGEEEPARAAITQLADYPAYAPHRSYLQGILHLRQQRYPEALEQFRQSAQQPELEIDTLIWSGQAFYQLGNAPQARALWQRALALNPFSVNAHRWLGVMYYDLGAMENALEHLKQASQLAPADPRPDRLMGLIYKDYERYQEAVERYQESLRRASQQPDRQQILVELAESQRQLSRYEDALQTAAMCEPVPAVAAIEAECYLGLGQTDHAAERVAAALQKTPDDPRLLLLQGQMRLEGGDHRGAVEALERASQLDPLNHAVHYNLSQAYALAGNETKAKELADRAQRIQNQWTAFATLHREAIEQPANADLRLRLGQMAEQLDRADLAVSWYRAALSIQPQHAAAKQALEKLLQATPPSVP